MNTDRRPLEELLESDLRSGIHYFEYEDLALIIDNNKYSVFNRSGTHMNLRAIDSGENNVEARGYVDTKNKLSALVISDILAEVPDDITHSKEAIVELITTSTGGGYKDSVSVNPLLVKLHFD